MYSGCNSRRDGDRPAEHFPAKSLFPGWPFEMALGTGAGGVGTYQVTPPRMVVVEVSSAGTGDLRQPNRHRHFRPVVLTVIRLAKGPYQHLIRTVTVRGQIVGQGMGNFFAELKRCYIYRVAAYVVAPRALT